MSAVQALGEVEESVPQVPLMTRRPKTGESTVTAIPPQPAASARLTRSAVKPRSGWM